MADVLERARSALRADDATTARALLEQANAHQPIGTQGEWLLAQACARCGDAEGERSALLRVLERNRREIPALLAMGQSFAKSGDQRTAISWYTAAVNQASAAPPPSALLPLLDEARRYCATAQQQLGEQFQAALADIGGIAKPSPALAHALDLLFGRQQIHLQQPSMFYYPGLPQRFFYEREEFAWAQGFEARADAMLDEFLALLQSGTADAFAPYVQRPQDRPASSNMLLDDPSWGAAYLLRDGLRQPLADAAPQTMAALTAIQQPRIAGRSPMALYSRLKPGTHIAPHHGLLNTRLICHMPLVAPAGCALRVGAETREWQFGKLLIFDDSIEHEAWNRGTSDRTVLLFEIWRPEIPPGDRELLTHIFETIDQVAPHLGKEQA